MSCLVAVSEVGSRCCNNVQEVYCLCVPSTFLLPYTISYRILVVSLPSRTSNCLCIHQLPAFTGPSPQYHCTWISSAHFTSLHLPAKCDDAETHLPKTLRLTVTCIGERTPISQFPNVSTPLFPRVTVTVTCSRNFGNLDLGIEID